MIISRRHGFAFFHNPKAGGTSVRASIERFNDIGFDLCGVRQIGGRDVDLAHQAPAEFARNYPRLWEDVAKYEKHCILRRPVGRLLSSIGAYQKKSNATGFRVESAASIKAKTFRTIDMLMAHGRAEDLPDRPELVLFKAQAPFAARGVRTWTIEEIPALLRHLGRLTAAPIDEQACDLAIHPPGPRRILEKSAGLKAVLIRATGFGLAKGRREPGRRRHVAWSVSEKERICAFAEGFYACDYRMLANRTRRMAYAERVFA